ncbi:hypothetical protein CLOM_g11859 [Closterium sp. NIES-68]|nr:hypothetical protein CLOM_g11859 [Closterium sp. NIES-68]
MGTKKLWVPKYAPLKQLPLEEYHDTVLAGHFGSNKTLTGVAKCYNYPNMATDIQEQGSLLEKIVALSRRPPPTTARSCTALAYSEPGLHYRILAYGSRTRCNHGGYRQIQKNRPLHRYARERHYHRNSSTVLLPSRLPP